MKICGIYKIISPTKKIYIGQSIDILNRWSMYQRLKCKQQTHLYNSLKKYGFDKHKFEIICQCDRSELNNLEKYYIALFQCFDNIHGLNLQISGEGGTCSDETKEKLRKFNTGKHHKEESKQKCRDYRHTEEAKIKISQAGIGRHRSQKAIEICREIRSRKVINTKTGQIYPSIISAANELKMKRRTLENMLHGTNGISKVKNKTNLIFYKEVA